MNELIAVALISAIPATIAALAALRNGTQTQAVSRQLTRASNDNLAATAVGNRTAAAILAEVGTLNGKSLAELADAIESRRISLIPERTRTDDEAEHMESEANPDELNLT